MPEQVGVAGTALETLRGTARKSRFAVIAGVLAVFAIAVLLRAWGLRWGIPDPARYYPYHPDESVLLLVVCRVNPLWGQFKTGFYNYPSLYVYLCRLVYDLLAPVLGWGPVPRLGQPFVNWVGDFAHLLLVGRWIAVLLGAATTVLVWSLGRMLFGARAGWIASVFLTVAPIPVVLGHYMAVDVPATFFATLALLLAAVAFQSVGTGSAVRWTAAGGFAAGLAIGTKYSCFPALFPLAIPLWAIARQPEPNARRLCGIGALAATAACAAAFLITTPGALIEPAQFLRDVRYEMELNRVGQGNLFRATPPAALYHLEISLPIGLEWPLYLLCLAGTAYALRERKPGDRLLLLFIVPFFLLLAPAQRKYVRYVTPLVPPMVVLASRLADAGLASRRRRPWTAWAAAAGAAALASTVAHLGVLDSTDPRDSAARYLEQVSRPKQVVALASDPWFYTPPIDPTAGCVKAAEPFGGPPIWERRPRSAGKPDLYPLAPFTLLAPAENSGSLSLANLRAYRPLRVVISDYEYADDERVRRADPEFHSGTLALMTALGRDYRLEREFRPRPRVGPFTWWRYGTPPPDWRYFMPAVRIYTLADSKEADNQRRNAGSGRSGSETRAGTSGLREPIGAERNG